MLMRNEGIQHSISPIDEHQKKKLKNAKLLVITKG